MIKLGSLVLLFLMASAAQSERALFEIISFKIVSYYTLCSNAVRRWFKMGAHTERGALAT